MLDAFAEIVKACLEDERILSIVQQICKLSQEEREQFLTKVKRYFFDKNDESSVEAYKFYLIILEDENAEKILKLVEEGGRSINKI
ncbi:hypothetical protein [Pseudothermotoga thermarum]|uniref:Uncharacterized protein n=1 Tax=Pseudothermotoga thermarum DSM 5069 TaxID=688269 RepID=F7YXG5_9THEM|nr:hypothetical protein [Pseudothermotoga thermarum]AEH51961.1 hypothetical protein Theth_1920 [Pseudothermotoga thermarum DSM 5069]